MPIIVRNFTHYASPCILYLYYTTYTIKANVYNALFVTVHSRWILNVYAKFRIAKSKDARAFELFLQGKQSVGVAIELDMLADKEELHV